MNQTTLKIAMAAFMHDMGKFAGLDELGISSKDIDEYDHQLYLPAFNGRYSHYHALYTAEFIKRFQEYFPSELNSANWGEGDIFTNLAAMHHKPESPMQWVIAVADRLSSGWDRDNFEQNDNCGTHFKDYKKTRLLPILEQLNLDEAKHSDSVGNYKYRYGLAPVTPKTIFPGRMEDIVPKSNKKANTEYKELFDKFIDNLKILSHRDKIELWYEHFDSLMMIYTSHIPAARVGDIVADVSLYDHSRTSAALAAALYLFHVQTDSFTEKDIKSYDGNKFFLINGDFRGIQNFIFSSASDSQKFRSKILRGRSFAVSLLSELAADMLCRKIGLPTTSVILNAAGKFTIIAPNTSQTMSAVNDVKKTINDWLVKNSFGETVVNITVQEASCNDFTKDNFIKLWDRFNLKMEQEKYSGFDIGLYGGPVEGYLDDFIIEHRKINEPGKPAVCPLCGKRPATTTFQDEPVCRICRDHIFLGTNIVKKNRLAVRFVEDAPRSDNSLMEPVFGRYQVFFPENLKKHKNNILKYWNIGTDNITKSDAAVRFIKGYVPVYSKEDEEDERIISSGKSDKKKLETIEQIKTGDPKTLNHIACMAKKPDPNRDGKYSGIEALGVLKADVDNLGLLMACGLKEKRYTLSRMATLSRQMNYYFTVYLPWFLENKGFNNIYTVFAGGDDLFLIGPWNSIIELAGSIHQSFADYVCQNKNITFSAGISLHKPHSPIGMMAESSENFLELAKSDDPDEKNRLTLFSETAKWSEIHELIEVEAIFEKWLDEGWISRVMFYRLNEFIKMAEKEKQVTSNNEIHMSDMACTKWRALLAYAVERNIGGKKEEQKKAAQEIMVSLTQWIDTYKAKLRIPLWKILYNRRQEG